MTIKKKYSYLYLLYNVKIRKEVINIIIRYGQCFRSGPLNQLVNLSFCVISRQFLRYAISKPLQAPYVSWSFKPCSATLKLKCILKFLAKETVKQNYIKELFAYVVKTKFMKVFPRFISIHSKLKLKITEFFTCRHDCFFASNFENILLQLVRRANHHSLPSTSPLHFNTNHVTYRHYTQFYKHAVCHFLIHLFLFIILSVHEVLV